MSRGSQDLNAAEVGDSSAAPDPELLSLADLKETLASKGSSVGPLASSPAGALPSGSSAPDGPPSVVVSPDFSQGVQTDEPGDAGSEARWWDQVRDVDLDPSEPPDVLKSSVIDFATTFRLAVQSQCHMPEHAPLKLPWEEGIFG